MRLKEIKPGMAIQCKNDEEKITLLEEADRLGYMWINDCIPVDCRMIKQSGMTIHFHDNSGNCDFAHIAWSNKTEGVTEFSDLIIPDPELSAEDALLAYDQMCKENYCCNDCPIYGIVGHECAKRMDGHIAEIVDVIKKWKSGREKNDSEVGEKEPKIETVDICRIIEVLPDGERKCVHEEDLNPDGEVLFKEQIENILKRYCMEHDGEFIAVHEVVSRVKAVE